MRNFFIAVLFCLVLPAFAAAPPRGSERLRELVVFPQVDFNFNLGMTFQGDQWIVSDDRDKSGQISKLQTELMKHPDDVKALLKLGLLLDNNGQTNESQIYYQEAEKICRGKVAANPEDGLALDDLGEALSELERNEEAENMYRKAVLVSPNDWRSWIRLGNFLPNNSFFSMYPENLRGSLLVGLVPSPQALNYRPSPEALQKAQHSLNEASRCFDRAIAIDPKNAEVFFQRAGYMSISNWQSCFFRHYYDNENIKVAAWLAYLSKETIANLQKAAELSPQNFNYLGLAASLEFFRNVTQANTADLKLDMLPEESRQLIHGAMTRLEDLSESPDPTVAAGALENLGFLYYALGDSRAAAADFREAISLDPSREQSWDMLLGILAKEADFPEEAVTLSQSRLKYENSARNHILLAKVFVRQKRWNDATEQAEIAASFDTNNVVVPLLLAAIELKQDASPDDMSDAQEQLNRAYQLEGELSSNGHSEETWQRWRELCLDEAIFYGLEDTPDAEKSARDCLAQVLKFYPRDEMAKQILAALN